MSRVRQVTKALQLLRRPRFFQAMLRHRIGATTEHFEAIRLCKAATLLDIGANKGQFSLAYREFFPERRIMAFAPFPESAFSFRALFAGDAQAELHQTVLADAEGEANFYVTTRKDGCSMPEPYAMQEAALRLRDEKAMTVPMKRLDQIVNMGTFAGPVLLKFDLQTEGDRRMRRSRQGRSSSKSGCHPLSCTRAINRLTRWRPIYAPGASACRVLQPERARGVRVYPGGCVVRSAAGEPGVI